MKKYLRIGIHYISIDYEKNNVVLVGSHEDDFELKVIHNNKKEVQTIEENYTLENGIFKIYITEKQFMNELRTVLMMAETKAMELHDPKTFKELQKQES